VEAEEIEKEDGDGGGRGLRGRLQSFHLCTGGEIRLPVALQKTVSIMEGEYLGYSPRVFFGCVLLTEMMAGVCFKISRGHEAHTWKFFGF
jgi:hypothetical protein